MRLLALLAALRRNVHGEHCFAPEWCSVRRTAGSFHKERTTLSEDRILI